MSPYYDWLSPGGISTVHYSNWGYPSRYYYYTPSYYYYYTNPVYYTTPVYTTYYSSWWYYDYDPWWVANVYGPGGRTYWWSW